MIKRNYLIDNATHYVYELDNYLSFSNIIFPVVKDFSDLQTRIFETISSFNLGHEKMSRGKWSEVIASDITETIGVKNLVGDDDIITEQKIHLYSSYILVGTIKDDKSYVGKSINMIYWLKNPNGKKSVEIMSPDEIKQKYFNKTELTDEQKRYVNNLLIESIKSNSSGIIKINELPCYGDYTTPVLKTLIENELKSKGWKTQSNYCEIRFAQQYKKEK